MRDSKRLRILLVTRNLPPLVGGMERLNWHMAHELSKIADVRVIGPSGSAGMAPAGVIVREARLQPLWKFLLHGRALTRGEARAWKPIRTPLLVRRAERVARRREFGGEVTRGRKSAERPWPARALATTSCFQAATKGLEACCSWQPPQARAYRQGGFTRLGEGVTILGSSSRSPSGVPSTTSPGRVPGT